MMRMTTIVLWLLVTSGCGDAASKAAACADCEAGQWSDERAYCVEVLNELRAQASRPPLTRSAALETCATAGAQSDAASGSPHGHFVATGGCGGTTFAENETPGWPLQNFGSVREVIRASAQMMYDEGPGGGHHDNIVGDYTEVGCGIHVTDADAVWVVHNFR